MPDNKGLGFDAYAFVTSLATRNIALRIRSGRGLELVPKSAWQGLSIEERAALKQHRMAIRDLVAAGPAKGGQCAPAVVEPQAAKPPAPCPYCQRTCVGPDHVAYEALHWGDPEEIKKRDERATQVMKKQWGRGLPGWYLA
jgi:hypothetical protein